MTANKPPIGVTPKRVAIHLRCQDLANAIQRYIDSGSIASDCVLEWIEELAENINVLRKIKNKTVDINAIHPARKS